MSGIVYSGQSHVPPGQVHGSDPYLGRFGQPIHLPEDARIPPGMYFVMGDWRAITLNNAVPPVATHRAMPAGFCISDGNAQVTGAGETTLIPVGARGWNNPPVWPWPEPWPLSIM